ncbi:DUF1684 domain-containing protein [Actinospica sp.]|uniref:DUF1684 domain-containing protein n=1 Tax=Actinospica sp. TaxID=1872142 RepID=UPI002B68A742|nr:DUF1684 domain-containing protein [Actinospica sp.]HWG23142.1 DUF1684 domain-containing protein [Actinospica sp.]
MSDVESWRKWRTRRDTRLRDPHGTLALTGTHWLDEEPAPIVEGQPVLWSAGPEAKTVTLTAKAEHGLVLNGEPIDGTVTLRTDTDEHPDTVTAPDYDILLVPIERDGSAALRVYDPKAATLQAFDGIEAFDFDPVWIVPARFTPFAGPHVEKVLNADGVVRGLGLDGTVEFELEDGRHTLQAALTTGGRLWIVFADPTTAEAKPFFRFLTTPAPAEDGTVTLDFNRAYLAPCAFTDHYVCPLPPKGNTFESPIRAGELAVKTR